MNKEELLTRILESRDRISALWANLPAQKLDAVADSQTGWSIKVLIAHLSFWERATLDCSAGMMKPGAFRDIACINASLITKSQARSVDDVLREFQEARAQVKNEIRRFTEEQLQAPSPWNDGKPLWEHLADDTYVHYEEHESKLRKWIA